MHSVIYIKRYPNEKVMQPYLIPRFLGFRIVSAFIHCFECLHWLLNLPLNEVKRIVLQLYSHWQQMYRQFTMLPRGAISNCLSTRSIPFCKYEPFIYVDSSRRVVCLIPIISVLDFVCALLTLLWVSEWLLFSANSAIFQLYRGENKLIFNEMTIRSALY